MISALVALEARIASACEKSHRPRAEVTLIAVSKRHPSQRIKEAHELGVRDFGENYAQELRDKASELLLEKIVWHAIGPVQLKNAKYIAKHAQVFHALESLEIAQELSKRRLGLPALSCFIEVNVANEVSKAGIQQSQLTSFVEQIRGLPNLDVIGLTAMPPLTQNPEANRMYFRQLKASASHLSLSALSMGTTTDFEVAIEEGATHIRVGTALFGERPTQA
jgi:PLP dependent protein